MPDCHEREARTVQKRRPRIACRISAAESGALDWDDAHEDARGHGMKMKGHWVSRLGRLDCGHRHRGEDAAERCLLRRRTPGSRDLGRVTFVEPVSATRAKRRASPPPATSGGPGTICIRCRQSMWLREGDGWICGGCDLQRMGE